MKNEYYEINNRIRSVVCYLPKLTGINSNGKDILLYFFLMQFKKVNY